jgi:hypothetical protein
LAVVALGEPGFGEREPFASSNSFVRPRTPRGGLAHSGLGRDAVDAFTETKDVFISTED